MVSHAIKFIFELQATRYSTFHIIKLDNFICALVTSRPSWCYSSGFFFLRLIKSFTTLSAKGERPSFSPFWPGYKSFGLCHL